MWNTAPVGGEFTSAVPMERLLGAELDRTLALLSRSHATFLGPKVAWEENGAAGRTAVLGALGYRLGVTWAALRPGAGGTVLELHWVNTGTAPLYWDWPVQTYVYDKDGALVQTAAVDIRLSELVPGQSCITRTVLKVPGLARRDRAGCTVRLGIVDPLTGAPAVRLTTGEQAGGCMTVF